MLTFHLLGPQLPCLPSHRGEFLHLPLILTPSKMRLLWKFSCTFLWTPRPSAHLQCRHKRFFHLWVSEFTWLMVQWGNWCLTIRMACNVCWHPLCPYTTSLRSVGVQRAQGCPGLTQWAEQPLIDSIGVACLFLQPQNTTASHVAGSNTAYHQTRE